MKGRPREIELPESLHGITTINTNTEENPEGIREAFGDLMSNVIAAKLQQRENEEASVFDS